MAAISITASAVLSSGAANGAVIKTGVAAAGVTITAGQAIYKLAVGTYGLCDNDVSLLVSTFAGIALSGASPGQIFTFCESDPAFTLGGTTVKGTAICTSPTAGGITLTPGDNTTGSFVTVIGMCLSTTQVSFGLGYAAGAAI